MKNLVFLFSFLFCSLYATASTNITISTVAGHWTLAGSPFLVYNDISIDSCSSLTIDPGVEVIFQGNYSFHVYGSLIAEGSAAQHILFHVNDTTGWSAIATDSIGCWKGISWDIYSCSLPDATAFKYCEVSDIKSPIILEGYRADLLEYCYFHHNFGSFSFASYQFPSPSFEIAHCAISGCTNWIDTISYYNTSLLQLGSPDNNNLIKIHDCDIYNNIGNLPCIDVQNATFLFEHNNAYGNAANDSSTAHGTIFIRSSNVTIRDNKIYGNSDGENAALYSVSNNIVIERNYICNNRSINGMATGYMCGASQGGGGIRIACDPDSIQIKAIIRDNVIANNFSGFGGGGIYVINATVEIVNNHIVNNSGARGGGVTFNNYPANKHTRGTIKNNLFYNNVSITYDNTGGIITKFSIDTTDVFTDYADTLFFEYNWIKMPITKALGLGSIWADTSFQLRGDTTTNFIGINPGMISPTLTTDFTESALVADFGLIPTSSCINRGTTMGIDPGFADYIVDHRIYGSSIDIGAYEYGAGPFDLEVQQIATFEKTWIVYPNPAHNELFVSVPDAKGKIVLYDFSGRKIAEKIAGSVLTSFDIHTLPQGIYFVEWNNDAHNRAVKKIVME